MLPPRDRSKTALHGPFLPSKEVYNPKAFIPHAASLGQAFAHCRRFSTAATRRCLDSVSVPVCRVMLSHPVGIVGLVSRYLTNYLIPRRPVPERNHTFGLKMMPSRDIAGNYPQFPAAMPNPRVGYLRITHPCATPHCWCVRLACLIHAANVHSEPGSNPSKYVSYVRRTPKHPSTTPPERSKADPPFDVT